MERLSNIMRIVQESSHLAAQQHAPQQHAAQEPQQPARRPLPEQNGHPGSAARSSGLYRSRSALPLRIPETRQESWEEADHPSARLPRTGYGSQRLPSPPQTTRYTEEPLQGDYYEERDRALSADVREDWSDDTAGMCYGDWENASDNTDDRERQEVYPATRSPSPEISRVARRLVQLHSRENPLATRELHRTTPAYLPAPRQEHESRLPQPTHPGPPLPQRTTQPLRPQQTARLSGEIRRRVPHAQQPGLPDPPPSTGADYTIRVKSAPHTCPFCKGAGFLRNDVPFGHPQFGKAIACQCKEQERKRKRRQYLQEISNLGAFASKRFETFNSRVPGMQEAFHISQEFARGPNGWLLLIGPSGCGKTHLAAAIANECLETGAVVLFATVPDLLDHLRAAFAPDSNEVYDQLFARMREAEVLVLDDLGVQQSSPWASEKLFQLFNHRYNSGFPTVITANSRGLQATDERIRSRLGDIALVTTLNLDRARDYRPNNPHRR